MDSNNINLDDDGYINEQYYLNACIDIIDRGIQDRGRNPDHITTNQLRYYLYLCYEQLFKPSNPNPHDKKTTVECNPTNIKRLIHIYLTICDMFQALPSFYMLSRFVGIEEDTLQDVVTSSKQEVTKHRKDYIQNRLNDSTVGVIALANNDIDTSLLYTRQNLVDHATVKKALSFSDLRQIAQKTEDGG